jgi:UDP-GlcNAc:undecaprenyl-phosphate GlcNAc-1-phosphate transferase
MNEIYVLVILSAFLFATMTMPLTVYISNRFRALSDVGGRHVGNRPIGRLGGIGVLVGIFISLVTGVLLDEEIRHEMSMYGRQMYGLAFGGLIVAGIGFVDDVRRLKASTKLIGHLLSASVAYFFGLRILGVDLPFVSPLQLGWLSFPISVLWIVGLVNAINLIDGLDGLAGGVVFFASIVNLAAASVSGAVVSGVLMASTLGAILGFLIYNWYPAKVYLGDGGAYLVGFVLSCSSLLAPLQKASTGIALMVPVLAVGLPIIDMSITMFRRVINQKGLFSADRGHLHHILLDSGISHRQVVIGLYLFSAALCSLALLIVLHRRRDIGCVLLVASIFGGGYWGFLVRLQLQRALRRVVGKGDLNSKV